MSIRFPVIFTLLLSSFASTLLASDGTQNRPLFHFAVTSIIEQHQDTCFATLRGGTNQGLYASSLGQFLEEQESGALLPKGQVMIRSLFDTHAIVAIVHRDFANQEVQLDDLNRVSLPVAVPFREHRGIFFELVKQGVALQSLRGQTLLDRQEVLELESQELERMLLADLLDEAIFTGEEMQLQGDDPQITEGLFAGDRVFAVMEHSENVHINSFLHFMVANPQLYGLNSWNFAEVYATWVSQGAPHTSGNLQQLLLASNESDVALQSYKRVISPNMIDQWNLKAQALAEAEAFNEALDLNELALDAAAALEHADQTGWGHYYLASIRELQDEQEASAEAYQVAIDWFRISGNTPARTLSATYLGATQIDLGQARQARKTLRRAIKDGQSAFQRDQAEVMRSIITCGLVCFGEAQDALHKPRKAIKAYEYALSHQQSETDAMAHKQRLYIYGRLAASNQELGNTREMTGWKKKLQQEQEQYRTIGAVSPKP